jgi:hypothetical protein
MPKPFDVEPWPWQPNLCPADEQFISWLLGQNRSWLTAKIQANGPVFHMGPGSHHRVAKTCDVLGVYCFSMTVSEEEEFMKPDLFGYRVLLGNINDYDLSLLPQFQIMTLFHFGEMPDRFGEPTRERLLELISKVEKGGLIFFYRGSSAWDRVDPLVTDLLDVLLPKPRYLTTPHLYQDLMVIKKA